MLYLYASICLVQYKQNFDSLFHKPHIQILLLHHPATFLVFCPLLVWLLWNPHDINHCSIKIQSSLTWHELDLHLPNWVPWVWLHPRVDGCEKGQMKPHEQFHSKNPKILKKTLKKNPFLWVHNITVCIPSQASCLGQVALVHQPPEVA